MNYKIGICDADAHYSVSLMEYINMHADIPFQCAAFSNVRAISEYTERNRLDLVLLDENMECDIGTPCVKMTEKQAAETGKTCIYKYQRIDDIVSQVIHIIGMQYGGKGLGIKIYGIYSPLGRCGKTSLAMGICNRYHGSLYIGMEEYCGASKEILGQAKNAGEHFLYFLLNKNEEVLGCIDAAPRAGSGFSMLSGTVCYQDYRSIRAEHINWLCDVLRDRCVFSRVVFDIGTGVLTDMNILDCFDRVFLPVLQDDVSRRKIGCFMDFVNSGIFAVAPERISSICVPAAEYDSREMETCIEDGGM